MANQTGSALRTRSCTPLRAVTASFLLLVALPGPGRAQSEAPPEGSRKWVFAVAGGLLVGVPAYLAEDFGVGGCSSRNCFAPLAAAVAAVAGFMIGAELDQAAARTWVDGPKADLAASSHDVPLIVDYMAATAEGVALIGEAGLARANPVVGVAGTHAARGLLAAAVTAKHEALIAASASALLAFDLDVAARGARRIFGEGGAALASDGGSRLLLGGEGTLRLLRLEGEGIEVAVTEEVTRSDPGPARALAWQPGEVIWELAGSRVAARSVASLEEVGWVALPGPGRAMSVEDGTGVVAGGESGVTILDTHDPSSPRVVARYQGVRYAFDAEMVGRTAYVAAGEQGLITLDLTDPSIPVVRGVAGNLGMPYAVVRTGGSLYVLDRENRRLHILAVGESASAAEPGADPAPR